MKQNTYQQKLRQQIMRYFAIAIAIMTVLLLVVLASYNRGFVELQLRSTQQEIQRAYNINVNAYKRELKDRNVLYEKFVRGEVPVTELYYTYYTFNARQEVKGELLLFDGDMGLLFSSNPNLERGHFFHYLKTVAETGTGDWTLPHEHIYLHEDKEHYLILLYPIGNAPQKGYAAYIINGKEIRSLISQSEAEYVLYDQFRNVFSSSSPTFLWGPLKKMDRLLLGERFAYGNERYQTNRQSLSEALDMVVYRKANLHATLFSISMFFIVGACTVMFLIAIYLARRLSAKNAVSVELLSSELGRIHAQPLHRVQLSTGDEFEEISHDINRMLEQLSEMHHNNLELKDRSLQAERKKLEAQFNPHFLYNTLEVIRSSLHFAPSLANDLILKLNKILRYSINEQDAGISLEEDLEYIREYLEICKQRFEYFDYVIELDKGLGKLPVPKLFLLPLIENSLKYGYPNRQDLKIVLKIIRTPDGRILVVVGDNGMALDQEACDYLNASLQRNENRSHHGLFNTKRRLELMYPSSSLEVAVGEEGTAVMMEIGGKHSYV